jgi:hypothetical protein
MDEDSPIKQMVAANLATLDPACDSPPKPDEPLNVTLGRRMKHPGDRGYVKFLTSLGYDRNWAGLLAAWVVATGRRKAQAAEIQLKVVEAVRFIAKPGRRREPFLCQTRIILSAFEDTDLLEGLFEGAPLRECKFIEHLRLAVEGDRSARQSATTIAAAIKHRASVRRGPKVSPASAAHEYLLETLHIIGSGAYTWSDIESGFTDQMTQATAEEFDEPGFDPRPAYRRVRTREALKRTARGMVSRIGATIGSERGEHRT